MPAPRKIEANPMDTATIKRGGERKRLLFIGSVLFAIVALLHLICLLLVRRNREFGHVVEEGFFTFLSCAFISGLFLPLPAFFTMLLVKQFRSVEYVVTIGAFAVLGAVLLGLVFCWFDPNPDFRFVERQHRFSDIVRGALTGFDFGLIGGSVLVPILFLLFPRQRALPLHFDNQEDGVNPGPESRGIRAADDTGITSFPR
jgi:hypothetical protein